MGNENNGGSRHLPELDQFVLQLEAQFDIQLTVWLVHQQQLRLGGEGPRNGHPLQHTGGELLGVVVTEFGQAHNIQILIHQFIPLLGRCVLDVQTEGHVLRHREPGHGGVALKDVGDVAGLCVDWFPVHQDLSGRQVVNMGQTVEERGLTAAGGPYHAQQLALIDVKGDLIQHQQIAESLGQIVHMDFHFPGLFAQFHSSASLTWSCPRYS